MMAIPIEHILLLSAALFSIGVVGVLTRRNVLIVFMCIELMFNAVNIAFIGIAFHTQTAAGVLTVFFVLVIAAAEAVVGLSIVLALFRQKETVWLDHFNLLKY